MPACIFTIYFKNGKDCDHNFKCDKCEVSTSIKKLVEIILKQQNEGERHD